MQAFLRAKCVLEHVRGIREGLVHIAATQLGIEREIGVFLSLEVLEVGKTSCRLELVVHVHRRSHRLDFVVDCGQFLVFGDDFLRRGLGDMRIGGEHDGDRLADEPHLVDRQDRLIMECRTVIGIGNDLGDVLGGDDAIDARDFFRRAHVDRLDAAVRHGAAEDFSVQHAGQPHRMGVFGAADDLVARFEPRQ